MKPPAAVLLPLAFVAGTLLVGWPHWHLPYRQAELPGSVLGPGLLALALIAMLLVGMRLATMRQALVTTLACLPAAVIGRVVFDVAGDPTSHNLWPFELVLAVLVGAVAVLPGIGFGLLLRRLLGTS